MKSKTSLYNWGLGKNLIKRYWPIWFLWLAALISLFTLNLAADISIIMLQGSFDPVSEMTEDVLDYGLQTTKLIAFSAPIVAMLVFSFMYSSRNCGMIASLPIKRETVFITSYITGLGFMILAEVITAVVTITVCGSSNILDPEVIAKWLGMAVAATVAFFGFAVFCAQLTGSIVILPLAYIILNITPYMIYSGVGSVIESMVYGFSYRESNIIAKLSPILGLEIMNLQTSSIGGAEEITVSNSELFVWYSIAGIVFAVIALLLYRRRRMESTGDIVAIPILKPVFKYCMALACGGLFATVMNGMLLTHVFNGNVNGILVIVCLICGAFVGYFVAQMLLDKTVTVFKDNIKGFMVLAIIIAVLGICCEFDLLGFEKYVPETDNIESVFVEFSGETVFCEPKNIEKITKIHQRIIDDKEINEQPLSDWYNIGIIYLLKDGKTVSRAYNLNSSADSVNPAFTMLEDVINAPEAIASRAKLPEGCTFDNINYGVITGYYIDENDIQISQNYVLTVEQAKDFYTNCILPDAADGNMLRIYFVWDDFAGKAQTTLNVQFRFDVGDDQRNWKDFTVSTDARRCCEWIEKNTDLKIQSWEEADMRSQFMDLEEFAEFD